MLILNKKKILKKSLQIDQLGIWKWVFNELERITDSIYIWNVILRVQMIFYIISEIERNAVNYYEFWIEILCTGLYFSLVYIKRNNV